MTSQHFDVIVVGSGFSDLAAAYHLQTLCRDNLSSSSKPAMRSAARGACFRHPGIRSDPDCSRHRRQPGSCEATNFKGVMSSDVPHL
jgi:hypothetical protein